MRTTEQAQRVRRTAHNVSRRSALASRQDRRSHEQAAAIRQFQDWDREMIRLHGPLYHREMGYSVH